MIKLRIELKNANLGTWAISDADAVELGLPPIVATGVTIPENRAAWPVAEALEPRVLAWIGDHAALAANSDLSFFDPNGVDPFEGGAPPEGGMLICGFRLLDGTVTPMVPR